MSYPPLSNDHIQALQQFVDDHGIVDGNDRAPHFEEWRGRWTGQSPLILAPNAVEQISKVMAYCYAHDIPMVPQGGNTGLVGGQIPNGEILISTKRLNKVRDISPEGFTMTVEAGVLLAEAHSQAQKVDRLFPLSIGSEGSCQIGGNLSTNAGGVHVIKYGNTRDLVLGIEAVLPDGRVWNGLNRLRKNNTGYDLKHLFIGAEGTLGIITAAVLKIFPRPQDKLTIFVNTPTAESAVSLLSLCQDKMAGSITAFELMNEATVDLILKKFPQMPRPVESSAPYSVLIEFENSQKDVLPDQASSLLEQAMSIGLVSDGTIAANQRQSDELWNLRHHASAAMKQDPAYCVKCDVSVPISQVPAFLDNAADTVLKHSPGARIIAFGHLGDGNIHYDVLGPISDDHSKFQNNSSELEQCIHEVVMRFDGSISAEHGIGILKRDELGRRKDPVELDMMRSIKSALDPKGLMNPGKLLPHS